MKKRGRGEEEEEEEEGRKASEGKIPTWSLIPCGEGWPVYQILVDHCISMGWPENTSQSNALIGGIVLCGKEGKHMVATVGWPLPWVVWPPRLVFRS